MASETRRPTGDSNVFGFTLGPPTGAPYYVKVDEEVADDITTYLQNPSTNGYAFFTFSAFTVPTSAVVNSLTMWHRSTKNGATANHIATAVVVASTVYHTIDSGGSIGAKLVWETSSFAYVLNPKTNTSWLPEDVNGGSANPLNCIGVWSNEGNPDVYCTQIYAVVDYTEYVSTSGEAALFFEPPVDSHYMRGHYRGGFRGM